MMSWLSNLRVRFLGLVLVAVLPALGLLIYSASEQRDQAIAAAQENTSNTANLAADQGRVIESTRQLLVVLSRLPEIRDAGTVCDGLMEELTEEFPRYADLGVVALDGGLVCSAVAPRVNDDRGSGGHIQQTIASGEFTVGEYQLSLATGRPVLDAGYPVLDIAGELIGVVYASLDLGVLAGEFSVESPSILTVFDRNGTALIRQPPLNGFIGTSLAGTPVVATVLADAGAGVAEQVENGEAYLYAYAPLGGADAPSAYLSIAILESEVLRPAEQAFSANLTRLGLVVVVILIGAWVGADLLIRRNTDTHKVLVRRIYDAFGSGGVDLLDEVVADDFRDHDPMPGQSAGLAGLKQAVTLFRAAFPDGEMLVDDMVAEGDKVVTRVTMRGTQRGTFFGQPASGRIVSAEGIEVYRIDKGKIVEGWSRFVPPLLEADEDDPAPEPLVPTAREPDLTVGGVVSTVGAALRRRMRRRGLASEVGSREG